MHSSAVSFYSPHLLRLYKMLSEWTSGPKLEDDVFPANGLFKELARKEVAALSSKIAL